MQFPVTYRRRVQVDLSSTSKSASEDMINRMPESVISNIMDRLPIQEAVRTSILSRNWRFTWTLITQLVFDYKFFRYLRCKQRVGLFYRRNLIRVLLQLKGSITKFVLYIHQSPGSFNLSKEERKLRKEYYETYEDIVEDINYWILFLSTKGIKDFTLLNMCHTPLKLPNHLFSCLELKHLKLRNCCLHPVPGFHCLPKLLRFDFDRVSFVGCKYEEFITMCPLLEYLKIDEDSADAEEVKLGEIAKLVNLKVLSLRLDMLGDKVVVTSSDILQLVASLPKLEMLTLDFAESNMVLAKAGACNNGFSGNLHRLMKLALENVDYENHMMVECACDLINGLPNLPTLMVTHAEYEIPVSGVLPDVFIKGNLQLQYVEFEFLGSETEERFIESLLACSPLLKKMVIKGPCDDNYKDNWCSFARKLKFHRASPIAEIHLD